MARASAKHDHEVTLGLAATLWAAVGLPAPPLVLPTIAGERFDLADLRGHPALVSFLRHAG